MNYINLKTLNDDVLNNIHKIPNDIELIVGIPRSGMIVATLLSVYINKPLTDIETFVNKGHIYKSGNTKNTNNFKTDVNDLRKVLIVDDSISSGKAIEEAKNMLKHMNQKINFIYLAAYVAPETRNKCDIFFRIVDLPRCFEWNLFHHQNLKKACVDIDGVLCIDPTKNENDDGKNYEKFIRNAKVKYIPTVKIGYIVTSRLEKYRSLTEEWLKKNNIEYGKLIMLDLPNAEMRKKFGNYGQFKGEIYKKIKDSTLFVESEYNQAKEIQNISKKDVICIDNNYFIKTTSSSKKIKIVLKKIIKKYLTKNQIEFIKQHIRR